MNKTKKNANPAVKMILVVDDHPIVRDGLADLINCEADLLVCAKAGNIAESVEAVKSRRIDLALIDMLLVNETGIQVAKKIKALCPDIILIIFSMSDEPRYIKQAFEAGARGYITKDELSEKIVDAIRQVIDGKIYLSEKLSKKFSKHKISEFVANGSMPAIPKLNEFLADKSKPMIPKGVMDNA